MEATFVFTVYHCAYSNFSVLTIVFVSVCCKYDYRTVFTNLLLIYSPLCPPLQAAHFSSSLNNLLMVQNFNTAWSSTFIEAFRHLLVRMILVEMTNFQKTVVLFILSFGTLAERSEEKKLRNKVEEHWDICHVYSSTPTVPYQRALGHSGSSDIV